MSLRVSQPFRSLVVAPCLAELLAGVAGHRRPALHRQPRQRRERGAGPRRCRPGQVADGLVGAVAGGLAGFGDLVPGVGALGESAADPTRSAPCDDTSDHAPDAAVTTAMARAATTPMVTTLWRASHDPLTARRPSAPRPGRPSSRPSGHDVRPGGCTVAAGRSPERPESWDSLYKRAATGPVAPDRSLRGTTPWWWHNREFLRAPRGS